MFDPFAQGVFAIPPTNVITSMKLDEDKYLVWKEKMASYIITYGLEPIKFIIKKMDF